MRNKCEYILVGQIGIYDEKALIPTGLYRLAPKLTMPNGFAAIDAIRGQSVYGADGKLKPEFQSLKRIIRLG